MKRTIVCVAIAIICRHIARADEAKPPERPLSPAAVVALKECEKSEQVAEEAYRQARLAAERKLIDKLKAALLTATKSGNLEEANRIDAQAKMAQKRIELLTHAPVPFNGPPPVSPKKIDLAGYIGEHPFFRYEFVGGQVRQLEFLPGGKIGAGGQPREHDWKIDGTAEEPTIIISGNVGDVELAMKEDGTFRGAWKDATGSSIILTPDSAKRAIKPQK